MASLSSNYFQLTNGPVSLALGGQQNNQQKKLQLLSAHRHPSLSIQSNDYMDPMQLQTSMVTDIRRALIDEKNELTCMNMIDRLQRLSIDYHFKDEIKLCLSQQYDKYGSRYQDDRLYAASLWFRLMRQHGHYVSPRDVFNTFTDGERFHTQPSGGVEGLLALYEASYFGFDGEDILDEANYFSRNQLEHLLPLTDPCVARMVKLSFEQPIHKSIPRFSVRRYLTATATAEGSWRKEIEVNEGGQQSDLGSLHVLASLDFNIVQAIHQKELGDLSRWWSDSGFAKELTFARNNPSEWYMCGLALFPDPKFSQYRVAITKSIALIYLIDDLHDIYGTLDQLVLFTKAINRWETGDLSGLPSCMKICVTAIYNTTNEIVSMISKYHGCNPINIFKKQWSLLCGACLEEAKWKYNGITPKSDEYLNNGIISSGLPLVLIQTFFMLGQGINMDSVDYLQKMPSLISSPGMLFRLSDDLDNSKESKSEEYDGSYVECYMKEKGSSSSIDSATKHVKAMISNEWKKLNRECFSSSMFSQEFKNACLDLARLVHIAHCYEVKDRHDDLKELLTSLLSQKINSPVQF